MHRRILVFSVLLASTFLCTAQSLQQPPISIGAWPNGTIDLNGGWRVMVGDAPAFSQPGFDDSLWPVKALDADAATIQPGWRWYRLRLGLPANHPPLALLIIGPFNQFEAYLDGHLISGTAIQNATFLYQEKEAVVPLPAVEGTILVSIRVRYASPYTEIYGLSLNGVSLGSVPAIEAARDAAKDRRLLAALPSIAINLALFVGGCGAILLFFLRRTATEYLWLGLFLALAGLSSGIYPLAITGVVPLWVNNCVGDPIGYAAILAQIEFTYAFTMRRVNRVWRIYEAVLLAFIPIAAAIPAHLIPPFAYLTLEAGVNGTAVITLLILLFLWWVRGDREAGWLMLPSLAPAAGTVLNDLAIIARSFAWDRFASLGGPMKLGPIGFYLPDLADLIFVLSIGVVMVLRFTRVSSEQARAAAELEAAREIQRQLVPVTLPAVPGYRIEAAYLPAQEVGGDFYQVLKQQDGATLVLLGDVSGKGLRAAMTGALAIGAARTLASEQLSPGPLLMRLNVEMTATQNGGFITCLCVSIRADGEVVIANAGHLAPYRGGQEVLTEIGLPLGITLGVAYAETTLQLQTGDQLTLLTDGVLEAMSGTGELYGFDRTAAVSLQSAASIANAAQAFGQEDDITVLTLSRLPC